MSDDDEPFPGIEFELLVRRGEAPYPGNLFLIGVIGLRGQEDRRFLGVIFLPEFKDVDDLAIKGKNSFGMSIRHNDAPAGARRFRLFLRLLGLVTPRRK